MIKVNHSQADGGFAPLPAGEYEVIIEAAAYKKAGTGSDMVAMKLKVRKDIEQEGGGRVIFNNLVFNEKTQGMVQAFFKAAQIPDGTEFADYQAFANYITGKPIRAKLKITTYQGNERNEVHYFKETSVAAPQVAAPNLAGVPDPFATTAAPAVDPFATGAYQPPVTVTEDDLPF